LIALSCVLYEVLVQGKQWAPRIFNTLLAQRTGLMVSSLLLVAAALVALRRMLWSRGTKLDLLAYGLATAISVATATFFAFAAHAGPNLVAVGDRSGIGMSQLERLGEGARDAPKPAGRKFAAQLAFWNTGLRIPYRDAGSVMQVFEPNPTDLTKRDEQRKSDAALERIDALMLEQGGQFEWGAFIYLGALAVVLVPGVMALAWRTTSRRTARARD
jgi:hypothetical protein